jgi:hypothetical protein
VAEELIAIDWITHLVTNAYVGFTTREGKQLIHISEDYLFKAPIAWLLRPTMVFTLTLISELYKNKFEFFNRLVLRKLFGLKCKCPNMD